MNDKSSQLSGQISCDDICQMKTELLDVIEQYLTEKRKDMEYDQEIAADVYYLLGKSEYQDHLQLYLLTSVSVLRTLTSKHISESLKQEIGTGHFFNLCKMLEKMVKFCWDIKSNEMSLAQLEQLMWRSSDFCCSVEYIKDTKTKYERLLENAKDNTI